MCSHIISSCLAIKNQNGSERSKTSKGVNEVWGGFINVKHCFGGRSRFDEHLKKFCSHVDQLIRTNAQLFFWCPRCCRNLKPAPLLPPYCCLNNRGHLYHTIAASSTVEQKSPPKPIKFEQRKVQFVCSHKFIFKPLIYLSQE